MNESLPPASGPGEAAKSGSRWLWLLVAGCGFVLLMAILWPRLKPEVADSVNTNASSSAAAASPSNSRRGTRSRSAGPRRDYAGTALPAEQVVSNKVSQFGRNRLEIARAMAKRFNVEVPAEVERFFAAVEAGHWKEIQASFESLNKQRMGPDRSEALTTLWGPILETFGVAEQAHLWPAQKLLDYGNEILDSLRPGMVYVGGTDPGRFIPTLLNETSEDERHIVLTQNAFADSTYLQYAGFLYQDRLATLSSGDSQRAFQDYLSDAQKRSMHDQQFPNEPRQLRPGEDVRVTDGRVQVSGQVAVMAINEKLLQMLMAKNPDASFAIEQSFPFKSTYGDASPLGPIMEIGVKDKENGLTAERAAQSVDYWQATSQQLLSDPDASSPDVRNTYSKMAAEQALLLLDRNSPAEAEQSFQIAIQLSPSNPESVYRYVALLADQKRFGEAIPVLENALQADPNNSQFRDLVQRLKKAKSN
jgi:tetratricopeptide (TPR) repeat protein